MVDGNELREMVVDATTVVGFTKSDATAILKILIPAGVVLLIAVGAYKNNYAASGKFFGIEFNLSPQC